jgi:CRP-like cAMP-binding protein
MTDDHDPRSLVELSASIESAQQAFQLVADEAFRRLEAIDPDFVAALLELFERRQAAASYLATIRFDVEPNAYATLAAGKRDRILELIARVKRELS